MKEKSITNQTGRSSRFGKLNKHDSQNHKLYIEPELLDDIQESIIMLDSEFKLVLANKQAEPLLPINTLPGAVIPLFKEWLPLEKTSILKRLTTFDPGRFGRETCRYKSMDSSVISGIVYILARMAKHLICF